MQFGLDGRMGWMERRTTKERFNAERTKERATEAAEKELLSLGDFDAAVGVDELKLTAAGADGAGERVAADGAG
jgi:hypothetical protein